MCVTVMLFFEQKTAYEMRISDWSSDVCSSDLLAGGGERGAYQQPSDDRRCRSGPSQIVERDPRVDAHQGRGQQHRDGRRQQWARVPRQGRQRKAEEDPDEEHPGGVAAEEGEQSAHGFLRSEEQTSELQSLMRIS